MRRNHDVENSVKHVDYNIKKMKEKNEETRCPFADPAILKSARTSFCFLIFNSSSHLVPTTFKKRPVRSGLG